MIRQITTPLFLSVLILAGCNFTAQDNATPTADGIVEEPINPLPQVSDTPVPPPTQTQTPTETAEATRTATRPPTDTPAPDTPTQTAIPDPPTAPPVPTSTPGPWEYVVQPNETLIEIIQREPFNYRTLDVIDQIVLINPNVFNADTLPVGEAILIPRPTATASPEAINPAPGGNEAGGNPPAGDVPSIRENVEITSDAVIAQHTVESGETVLSIVSRFPELTLALFAQINAEITFTGCNFELDFGGPNCNPVIGEGQVVNVLVPPPTPTPTPSPSGSETPTFTPTYAPPIVVAPPEGAIAPASRIRLSWIGIGPLEADEFYLVTVRDVTASVLWEEGTRQNNILLPAELIPTSGETHTIEWSVTIARRLNTGDLTPIGGLGDINTFQWQSR